MSIQNVNIARNVEWDFFWDFQTPCPVCFDLAKTWTIFNPLKKFSPNTLASRKARAAPLDQIFFFHHMQNICFEWTTWKWLAKPFWLLLIIYYPLIFSNPLMFLGISWMFFKRVFSHVSSCFLDGCGFGTWRTIIVCTRKTM